MTKKFWYRWHSPPCVRNKANMEGEVHPCYFCGAELWGAEHGDGKWCSKCHFTRCPQCGRCVCNIESVDEQLALIYLRTKYCCTREYFEAGVQPLDRHFLQFVPSFENTLNYCRKKEGVRSEVRDESHSC